MGTVVCPRHLEGKYHECAAIFPIDDEELALLAQDIKAHGLLDPIVLLDGLILDGRHRYAACCSVHVEPIYIDAPAWAREDPVSFVISKNDRRRHLDESQRALVASHAQRLYEKAARERQLAGAKDTHLSANLRSQDAGKSAEKAAKLLNVSPRSVESASKVLRDGAPELVAAVERGGVAVSAAAEVARLPKAEQAEIVKAGPAAVKEAARVVREERKAKPTPKAEPEPDEDPDRLPTIFDHRSKEEIAATADLRRLKEDIEAYQKKHPARTSDLVALLTMCAAKIGAANG